MAVLIVIDCFYLLKGSIYIFLSQFIVPKQSSLQCGMQIVNLGGKSFIGEFPTKTTGFSYILEVFLHRTKTVDVVTSTGLM